MFNLKEIVRQAAAMLPERYEEFENVTEKGGKENVVTHYDKEIQQYLAEKLRSFFPDANFLGEEGLNADGKDGILFIIDPIDGTSNFVQDVKFSCISVAMLQGGEPVEAAVFNPYLDEMFYAKKGCGAYLNDRQIKINDKPLSETIMGFSNCPYDAELTDLTFAFGKKLFNRCLDFRRCGSAALEICYAACGRYQLYCEMVLYPWDYAAAGLVVTEAGGVICSVDGSTIAYDKRYPVVAGCPTAAMEVVQAFKEEYKIPENLKINLF